MSNTEITSKFDIPYWVFNIHQTENTLNLMTLVLAGTLIYGGFLYI